MSEDGSASKKSRLRAYLWFLIAALVLVILNAVLNPLIAEHLHTSWSWLQFGYGLISVEICAAVYLYGVGSLSPHWRPDPPAQDAAAKGTLLEKTPAGGSHPLGPSLWKRAGQALSGAAGTQANAARAPAAERKPDAGKPGS